MLRAISFVLIAVCTAAAQIAPVALADEPHHHLLLENDYARVFSLVLAPHESTLLHVHTNDYVRIAINDGHVRFAIPGTADTNKVLNAALTQFIPGGTRHSVTNEDNFTTFRAIVVEMKKSGIRPATTYDYSTAMAMRYDSIALPVDPNATFSNRHSTPTVDGVDMQFLPKMAVSIESCESNCLIVALTDLTLQTTAKPSSIRLQQGEASWAPVSADEQALTNVSASPARFILLRFK